MKRLMILAMVVAIGIVGNVFGEDKIYSPSKDSLPPNLYVETNTPSAFREVIAPRAAIDLTHDWDKISVKSIVTSVTTNEKKQVIKKYKPAELPENPKWGKAKETKAWNGYEEESEFYRRQFTLPASLANKAALLRVGYCSDTFSVSVNGNITRYDEPLYGCPLEHEIPAGQLKEGENEIIFHFYKSDLNAGEYLSDRGHTRGLQLDTTLTFFDPVHIADVRIETQRNKRQLFIADVLVTNATDKAISTSLSVSPTVRQLREKFEVVKSGFFAFLSNGSEGFKTSEKVSLAPFEGKWIRLQKECDHMLLWNPDEPYLYFAQFELGSYDMKRTRFGFRHFEIKDHRFMLNGYPFMMRCGWCNGQTHAEAVDNYRRVKERGFNSSRLFCRDVPFGPSIEVADEEGIFVATCVESNNGGGGWAERQNPKFWGEHRRNALGLVHAFKNSPSVIVWGLGCEFGAIYAGEGTWREESVSTNLCANGEAVMKLDPTRTWAEYGGVEAGYPVKGPGCAPTRSFHYPVSVATPTSFFPDVGYWYPDGFIPWHRISNFKKPTVIPEDLYHGMMDTHTAMTKWAGDKIYDKQGYVDACNYAFQTFAEGYYAGGLALWEPWMTWACDKFNRLYDGGVQPVPDFMVAVRPFGPNLRSGETDTRKLYAYNQRFTTYMCELRRVDTLEGKEVNREVRKVVLTPGMKYEDALKIVAPKVEKPTKFDIAFELYDVNKNETLTKRTYEYTVFPEKANLVIPAKMALIAKEDSPLAKFNFSAKRYDNVADAIAAKPETIVVNRDLTIADGKKLNDFVLAGGRVLALDLEETSWTPVVYQRKKPVNFIWRRNFTAMKDVKEEWLTSWRPTGFVSENSIRKGGSEDSVTIFDAGQTDGLTAQLVLWLYREKGAWMLCQLPLVRVLDSEPCAATVLQSLLNELAKPSVKPLSTSFATAFCDETFNGSYTLPPPKEMIGKDGKVDEWKYKRFYAPFRTLNSSGPSYNLIFEKAKILRENDAKKANILFVDASCGLTEDRVAMIEEAAKAGKQVFVSELPFDCNQELLSKFGIKLTNPRIPEVHNGVEEPEIKVHALGDYPNWVRPLGVPGLLDGLSADDFVWYPTDQIWGWGRTVINDTFWPIRKSWNTSVITANIEPLSGSNARVLTFPSGVVEIKRGKGTIYFSTLRMRVFSEKYGQRINFVLRTMLNNLGAKTSIPEKVYESTPVDMSAVMNRNLWSDPLYKKADGTYEPAGWFNAPNAKESEQNDMRYFPVNLCGWSTTAGNFCPKGVFPTEPIDLGGKRFKIVDPSKNKGKAILVLQGDGESATIELKEPLKSDHIYLLAAAQDFEGQLEISFNGVPAEEIYNTEKHFNWFRYASTKPIGVTAWVGETVKDSTAGLWYWKVPNPKPAELVKTITIKNVTKKQTLHDGTLRHKLIAIVAITSEVEAQ